LRYKALDGRAVDYPKLNPSHGERPTDSDSPGFKSMSSSGLVSSSLRLRHRVATRKDRRPEALPRQQALRRLLSCRPVRKFSTGPPTRTSPALPPNASWCACAPQSRRRRDVKGREGRGSGWTRTPATRWSRPGLLGRRLPDRPRPTWSRRPRPRTTQRRSQQHRLRQAARVKAAAALPARPLAFLV
jgi:hypothetical protein